MEDFYKDGAAGDDSSEDKDKDKAVEMEMKDTTVEVIDAGKKANGVAPGAQPVWHVVQRSTQH